MSSSGSRRGVALSMEGGEAAAAAARPKLWQLAGEAGSSVSAARPRAAWSAEPWPRRPLSSSGAHASRCSRGQPRAQPSPRSAASSPPSGSGGWAAGRSQGPSDAAAAARPGTRQVRFVPPRRPSRSGAERGGGGGRAGEARRGLGASVGRCALPPLVGRERRFSDRRPRAASPGEKRRPPRTASMQQKGRPSPAPAARPARRPSSGPRQPSPRLARPGPASPAPAPRPPAANQPASHGRLPHPLPRRLCSGIRPALEPRRSREREKGRKSAGKAGGLGGRARSPLKVASKTWGAGRGPEAEGCSGGGERRRERARERERAAGRAELSRAESRRRRGRGEAGEEARRAPPPPVPACVTVLHRQVTACAPLCWRPARRGFLSSVKKQHFLPRQSQPPPPPLPGPKARPDPALASGRAGEALVGTEERRRAGRGCGRRWSCPGLGSLAGRPPPPLLTNGRGTVLFLKKIAEFGHFDTLRFILRSLSSSIQPTSVFSFNRCNVSW